jgi:hypothetical protein
MYCQCSFRAFSPHNSIGGTSESGKSQRRKAAAAQPRPKDNKKNPNFNQQLFDVV